MPAHQFEQLGLRELAWNKGHGRDAPGARRRSAGQLPRNALHAAMCVHGEIERFVAADAPNEVDCHANLSTGHTCSDGLVMRSFRHPRRFGDAPARGKDKGADHQELEPFHGTTKRETPLESALFLAATSSTYDTLARRSQRR